MDIVGRIAEWRKKQNELPPGRQAKKVWSLKKGEVAQLEQHCFAKGTELLGLLEARLNSRTEDDDEEETMHQADLKKRLRAYDPDKSQPNRFGIPEKGAEKLAREDGRKMAVISKGILKVNDLRTMRMTSKASEDRDKFTSQTSIDAVAGVLIATESWKENDFAGTKKMFNSDLLYTQYRLVAKEHVPEQSTTGLREVWRYSITNDVTVAIIEQCFRAMPKRAAGPSSFRSGSRNLAVLCRTPNGTGVVRMLKDHAKAFGFKSVRQVTIMWSEYCNTWHLCFDLEEHQPKGKKSRR